MSDSIFPKNLNNAVRELGQYFGVIGKDEFMNKLLALEEIEATDPEKAPTEADIMGAHVEGPIGEIFLDVTEGALFAKDMCKKVELYVTDGIPFNSDGLPVDMATFDAVLGKEAEVKNLIDMLYEPEAFGDARFAMQMCHPLHTHETGAEKPDPEGAGASMREMCHSGAAEEGKGVNQAPSAPASETPSLAAIMVKHCRLTPAHRDTGAVSLFMNLIPTLELSRCVPYMNIQFMFNRPPIDDQGRPNSMSLYGFLQGRNVLDPESLDANMLRSVPVGVAATVGDTEAESQQKAYAGMELFTVPQSMVNADEPDFTLWQNGGGEGEEDTLGGPRAAPIIDKMRPFASVEGLSVNVTPTGGMMCHKTAEMTITLHDRSRLSEMSEFVRPAMFGGTHMLIEYGWSHPDGGPATENLIGGFLNAMRVKEKYMVVNSKFKFDEVGQVTINLNLSMLGVADIDTASIGTSDRVQAAEKKMEELTTVIRNIRRQVSGGSSNGAASISGADFLGKVSSSSSAGQLDADTLKEIAKYIRASRRSSNEGPTGEALRGALEALVGTDSKGTGGALAELKNSVAEIVKSRKDRITDPTAGDPFFRTIGSKPTDDVPRKFVRVVTPACFAGQLRSDLSEDTGRGRYSAPGDRTRRKFVSLGKLVSCFVGAPLALQSKYDEVQLFFYPFNPHASYVKDFNIAQYPIDAKRFSDEIDKLTEVDANISLRRFLGFIQSKFISEQSAYAWGICDKFKDGDEGNRELRNEKIDATMLHDMKKKRLEDAYLDENGDLSREIKFKPPRLAMSMEAIPVSPVSAEGLPDNKDMMTILRVHIYDKQCSAYTSISDMLKASRGDTMGAINAHAYTPQTSASSEVVNKDTNGVADEWVKAIQKALDLKILEEMGANGPGDGTIDPKELKDGTSTFRVKGGFPQLKNFVKKTMPSIIYGSQNSAVLSADLASMNDPMLSTIHMMRQGQGQGQSGAISQDRGVPMKVSPTELSLDIIGCPLIRYGQQFFVDFGTGTTADNVYAVNGISHTLASGEFKTQLKMLQLDTFGQYESTLNHVQDAITNLSEADSTPAPEAAAT